MAPAISCFRRKAISASNTRPGIVFIQITWNAGRTTDIKKAFYKKVADDIHARAGIRRQDVWINLVEVPPENWSFGNGEMQYAPK